MKPRVIRAVQLGGYAWAAIALTAALRVRAEAPAEPPAPTPGCTFTPSGALESLYRGALAHRLDLACNCTKLSFADKQLLHLTAENLPTLTAQVRGATTDEKGTTTAVQLTMLGVPDDLPAKSTLWTVRRNGTEIGKVTLESKVGLRVRSDAKGQPLLTVSYRDKRLDQLHSRSATDGIAVVSPAPLISSEDDQDAATTQSVENTVGIDVEENRADGLEALAARFRAQRAATSLACDPVSPSDECKQAQTKCSEMYLASCEGRTDKSTQCINARQQCVRDEVFVNHAPWRVHALSWRPGVSFGECGEECGEEDEYWNEVSARLDDISSVTFGIASTRIEPLSVRVDLVDPAQPTEIYYSVKLVLSARARTESLPLPIASFLAVICGEPKGPWDITRNRETRAVQDADVEGGSCRLRYVPPKRPKKPKKVEAPQDPQEAEKLKQPEKVEAPRDPAKPTGPKKVEAAGSPTKPKELKKPALDFPAFGPQQLIVTVSRAGSTPVSQRWSILAPDQPDEIVLPIVSDGSSGTGPYEVRVLLSGAREADVVYRPSATASSPTASSATATLGQFEFLAKLRPRGKTGWRWPIRTFVTFPVEVFGFRLPAKARELHASSESPSIQATTAQVGVLLAVEPWNYNTGRNPLPIPGRFLTGFHIVDLAEGALAPAWVTGVSLTFPIIDLPAGTANNQLGTDVAIGAFWEVDLQERNPIRDGSYFLVTIGANVLSLFGSK